MKIKAMSRECTCYLITRAQNNFNKAKRAGSVVRRLTIGPTGQHDVLTGAYHKPARDSNPESPDGLLLV